MYLHTRRARTILLSHPRGSAITPTRTSKHTYSCCTTFFLRDRPGRPGARSRQIQSICTYTGTIHIFFCKSVRTTKGILSYLRTPKLFHVIVGDCGWEDDPNAFHFPYKCHVIPPLVYRERRGRIHLRLLPYKFRRVFQVVPPIISLRPTGMPTDYPREGRIVVGRSQNNYLRLRRAEKLLVTTTIKVLKSYFIQIVFHIVVLYESQVCIFINDENLPEQCSANKAFCTKKYVYLILNVLILIIMILFYYSLVYF